jgi:gliding motility-associated-like protein
MQFTTNLIITLFLFSVCSSSYAQTSDCSNIDFENGNLDNWNIDGNIELVNHDQTDFYGGFPLSLSGFYGVQLGNNQVSVPSSVTKSITITNSNKYFIYGFAIVLLGYPHSQSDASYVQLTVQDQNGFSIPCTDYIVYAESSVGNGFFQSTRPDEPNLGNECCFPIFFKPWEITALDLTSFIGQTLTFTLKSDWCVYNVDWGYAYVDAYCSSNFINEFINCEDNLLYLSAVNGLAGYTWTGPGIVSGQGTHEIQINQPGIYQLFVPSSNSNCPPLTVTYDATLDIIPDVPNAMFQSNSFACVGEPFDFNNQSSSDSYIVESQWYFGNGDTSLLYSPSYTYDSSGVYSVTLIVTNESNCSDTIIQTLTSLITPEIDLGPDIVLCDDELLELAPIVAHYGTSYLWSTGETTATILIDTPQEIVLNYSNGCTVSDTINIIDLGFQFQHIPNVITANADQVNDEFIIPAISIAEYSIVITNRWGNTVFESSDINLSWDGKVDNDYVNEDVYFYLIRYRFDCQKEMHTKHGNITVVR